MPKKGGRAARSGRSVALGINDPRIRRDARAQTTNSDIGEGLALDRHGRQEAKLGGPLFVNQQGEIDVRVAEGLEVTPGSPRAIRMKLGFGFKLTPSGSVTIPAPSGGDVIGPVGATDGDVAVFDGATGKKIADSGLLVDDVIVEGDSRLSDARTPTGSAGGDLGGTYPNPTVTQARGIRETGGPTTLVVGAIADGEFIKRVGGTAVGASGGTGDVVGPAGAVDTNLAAFDGVTGKLLKDSGISTASAGVTAAQAAAIKLWQFSSGALVA